MNEALERRTDIFSAASATGHAVTPAQLARWAAFGLIGRPRQVGLGRGEGTATVYPAGTSRRVLAICAALPRHRRLSEIAWQLWLDGEAIEDRLIRAYLESAARLHDRILALARMLGFTRPEVTARALKLLSAISHSRTIPRDLKAQVRSAERIETVMRASLQVMLGTYDATAAAILRDEDDDRIMVERAIGISGARTDRILDLPPLVSSPLSTDLVLMTRVIGGDWLPTVGSATSDELYLARERWRELFRLVVTLGETFADAFGTNLSGLPQMARLLRGFGPLERAFALIVLLRIERAEDPTYRKAFETLREASGPWYHKALPAFQALRVVRDQIPEFGVVLAPGRMREAITTKASFAAYTREVRRVAEQHGDAVPAVLLRAEIDVSAFRSAGD